DGLPGEHHFFITIDTRHEGVILSPRMRAQYSAEITIVLQHQFWDLTVTEDRFEVGLSFGGVPERLVVPFAAVIGFRDPSVQFVLQCERVADTAGVESGSKGSRVPKKKVEDKPARPPAEHKHKRPRPAVAVPPPPVNPAQAVDPPKPAGGGDVVQ